MLRNLIRKAIACQTSRRFHEKDKNLIDKILGFRILLIASSYGTGLTFNFTRLALALKRQGNEVVVLSAKREQYAELSRELFRADIKRYTCDSIDYAGIKGIMNGALCIRKIIDKEGDFDIIHIGGIRHIAKVFPATKWMNKKPKMITTVVSFPRSKSGRSSKLDMAISKVAYSLSDKSVAVCEYTRTQLKKWHIKPSKVCVIPLFAPDIEWFDKVKKNRVPLERYNLENVNSPAIFYAARHIHIKGFDYFLKAAAEVLRKFDATFIVGGEGTLTFNLKEQARKLGISNHTVFTGWISNYHMPYILSNIADVCVSVSLVEQLPSYIMEGMAAGKPVVASSVGGVPEVIVNEVNGYLVPPFDYEETARRITDLISDPEKARKMGLVGRKTIKEQLNMKSSVLKLLKVYEESVRS